MEGVGGWEGSLPWRSRERHQSSLSRAVIKRKCNETAEKRSPTSNYLLQGFQFGKSSCFMFLLIFTDDSIQIVAAEHTRIYKKMQQNMFSIFVVEKHHVSVDESNVNVVGIYVLQGCFKPHCIVMYLNFVVLYYT